MSTHYIHQPGLALLGRWGLLDRLIESGCPPVKQFSMIAGTFPMPDFFAPENIQRILGEKQS